MILYLDALVVKIRDGQAVRNIACDVAVSVNLEGERDVLGMWSQRTEGAKFWLQVLTELKNRGVEEVLVCCRRPDGLPGGDRGRLPGGLGADLPGPPRPRVAAVRAREGQQQGAADLRTIYTAADRDHAEQQLEAFAEKRDQRDPMISASWIERFEQIVPFLAFPPDLRRVVDTTNTIEALNRQIRKIIKTRGSLPTEDAARKPIYLAITGAQTKWRHVYNWSAALIAFRIHFGDRIPDAI